MMDIKPAEKEVSQYSVSENKSIDPDKRLDINRKQGINVSSGYDADKRAEISDTSKDVNGSSYNRDIRAGMGKHDLNQDSDYNPDKALTNYRKETSETDNTEQSNPHEEIHGDVTCYYDSNGRLYRIGNELIPDNEYEINGYKYKIDENGRIISAEGILHLKDRDGRLPIKDSIEDIGKGDEKPTDDRGHLIGDQFDGSNGLENLIPQDADVNRNDFKNFENELAKEVKDEKNVYIRVEPIYDNNSRRPSAIVVSYLIDGEESIRVFPNDKED